MNINHRLWSFRSALLIGASLSLMSGINCIHANTSNRLFYFRSHLAPSFGSDITVNNTTTSRVDDASSPHYREAAMKSKMAWALGMAFGFHPAGPWRYELDLGYQMSKHKDARTDFPHLPAGPDGRSGVIDFTSGRTRVLHMMPHVYYEWDQLPKTFSNIKPYVGLGLGYAHIKRRSTRQLTDSTPATYDAMTEQKTQGTFAYQVVAGMAVALTPKLSATVDYRYLATTKLRWNSRVIPDKVYRRHGLHFGLNYALG